MKKISEIHKLFIRKEGKELLGKHGGNFIILTVILVISLLSIAFARSSRVYLKERMEDPFVTWMDIYAEQNMGGGKTMSLKDFLENPVMQETYSFINPSPVFITNKYFYTQNQDNYFQFTGRSFDENANLFKKLISPDNLIVQRKGRLTNDQFGVIVTLDMLKQLGFSENDIPAFLYIVQPFNTDKYKELHYRLVENKLPVAIPILAVVKDIPGVKYSFIFSKEFYNVICDSNVWNIFLDEYNKNITIYGEERYFSQILSLRKDSCFNKLYEKERRKETDSWRDGYGYITISQDSLFGSEEIILYNDFYEEVKTLNIPTYRVYSFQSERSLMKDNPPLYSIEISNIRNVRALQNAIKGKCGIRLDMRDVESQENFYYVEFMSNILAWSIIVIAVVFIFVLIYFMLFTHFQKIQKNIGTFKAFGFSNKTLYGIYLVLIIGNVLAAFAISLCLLAIVQFILQLLNVGMMYEGILFPYFDIFISYTAYLLMIVIAVAVLSTIMVAYKKLHHTPGDLIYNRNQQ